ncbi:MAG: arginine repressor family protein [Fusobacteria bacterium]|nr:MAG: arginine repressor family protein [Fusobacteriota bacterium]KAF0229890.1 MAG: arginine repressor family [Fusobacteriota bacterium]
MNKKERQKLILNIIREQEIKTQSELVEVLEKRGLIATQATVSRDIKNLKLVKEVGVNGSIYRVSNNINAEITVNKQILKDIFFNTVVKIDNVEYLLVLHTRPGGAPNLAFYLDQEKIEGVIGTIAGDDTILVITNSKTATDKLLLNWREWLI